VCFAWIVGKQAETLADKRGSGVQQNLLSISEVQNATILTVVAEIDIANADAFREELDTVVGEGRNAIVSLADCPYIDSSGLRVLIALARRVGDSLSLVVVPGTQIRRVFEITSLTNSMRVFASVDEALAVARLTPTLG
jgi:anti-anti-sigma factor